MPKSSAAVAEAVVGTTDTAVNTVDTAGTIDTVAAVVHVAVDIAVPSEAIEILTKIVHGRTSCILAVSSSIRTGSLLDLKQFLTM